MKFQGVVSDYKELHNGTLQGGILSPFLFSVLMENIAKLALPRNVKIFIFADDITVVVTGNNQLMDAQEALNTIERECRRLGLKINPTKTKSSGRKRCGPRRMSYPGATNNRMGQTSSMSRNLD